MSEPNRRAKRVAQLIRDHVASYLVAEVGDPRLTQAVISEVRVSDDLSIAWIGVRLLLDQGHDAERLQCVKQLQLMSGRLRRSLAPALRLRRVPELRFAFDDGVNAQRRVEEILMEIDSQPAAKE